MVPALGTDYTISLFFILTLLYHIHGSYRTQVRYLSGNTEHPVQPSHGSQAFTHDSGFCCIYTPCLPQRICDLPRACTGRHVADLPATCYPGRYPVQYHRNHPCSSLSEVVDITWKARNRHRETKEEIFFLLLYP